MGETVAPSGSRALSPLPPPRCCLCPARPRFAPGVTIEEDNCCGCNAIAIRRHFLDENMTAVDIVYTSCHDAVRVQAGWCAASPQPGSCAGAGALGLAGLAPLGGRARAGLPPSPHILAWDHSGARTWTPALPAPAVAASWLQPWGERIEGHGEALGRGEGSPSDRAGRTWYSGRPSQQRWEGRAGWVLGWEGPTVTLAGLRGQWSQTPGPRRKPASVTSPHLAPAQGLLRLTSCPSPRSMKPPSTWQWTTTRRRW